MPKRSNQEEVIAWVQQYCKHYDPSGITMIGGKEPSGHCKAGVVYREQFGGEEFGLFLRICCNDGGKRNDDEQRRLCPKWERESREEGIRVFEAFQVSDARFAKVMPVVAEWRKRKPIGKAEVIKCPACGGLLHLAQASTNGHVHGSCETEGCVSWME